MAGFIMERGVYVLFVSENCWPWPNMTVERCWEWERDTDLSQKLEGKGEKWSVFSKKTAKSGGQGLRLAGRHLVTFEMTLAPSRVRVPWQKEKYRWISAVFYLAESMGLEPTRLLHPTRFPGELLSHSVNSPSHYSVILYLFVSHQRLI